MPDDVPDEVAHEVLAARVNQTALRHPVRALLWHTTLILVLLTVAYYVMPERLPWRDGTSAIRLAASLLLLALVAVAVRAEMRMLRKSYPPMVVRVQALLAVLYGLVLVFSVVYFIISRNAQGEFDGITNRTDALYFTMTTISTVGYGDVHASGTAARALVTVQMLFDLIYLGIALRLLTSSRGVEWLNRDQNR